MKYLLLVLCSLIVPWLIGMFYTKLFAKDRTHIGENIIYGYLIIWAVFFAVALPGIYLKLSLTVFEIILFIAYGLLALLGLIINIKRFKTVFFDELSFLKAGGILLIVVLAAVIAQAIIVPRMALGDLDDSYYVATAETAVATNTLMEYNPYTGSVYKSLPARYVLSPFPLFVTLMSDACGTSPAIMAHSMLPTVLILLAYLVYLMIAKYIFEPHKTGVFMLFTAVVLWYSYYSVYSQGVFMLTRIWQGKAVLTAILLPLSIAFGLRMYAGKMSGADWWLLLLLNMSCCMVSSMGIMLSAISIGISGIIAAIKNKKLRQLIYPALCCIPSIGCSLVYLLVL